MIPRRVVLEGFLCYKERQEISFEGSALWMLSGLNGSGKSSVFDAVTYNLFGCHRGGSQDAHELINKDCDRASVELDFTQDGQPYRAYRTLQRTKQGRAKGTQQIYRIREDGKAEPVSGTNLKTGYDAWVQENIGLTYETFTSSVLLLQGQAERLLNETAKGRFEVLAGIVDLERFERLHRRADDQRRKFEATVETLRARLDALPEVAPIALAEAQGHIDEADTIRQQAEIEAERLRELEYQAQQWHDLQGRLGVATRRWQHAESLLADATGIERDLARLRELKSVLPRLQAILEQRSQSDASEGRTRTLTAQKQQLQTAMLQHQHAQEQARRKREAHEAQIARDEQRLRAVVSRFREVTDLRAKLQEYEQQERALEVLQKELARLPGGDPAEVTARCREACDTLSVLAQVVPSLARLYSLRDELPKARARQRQASDGRRVVQERGEQLAADAKEARRHAEEATRLRQAAADRATEARTLHQQATHALRELQTLDGAKVCRHCGQALTPGHLQEEQRRRSQELKQAETRSREADAALAVTEEKEREARERLARLEEVLQDTRTEFLTRRGEVEQAERDVQRVERECAQVYGDLTEPFRSRVAPALPADWCTTTWPDANELAALRQQVADLPAGRQKLREAEQVQQRWTTLRAQETPLRQTLDRLRADLPADRQGVRQEHARLQAEDDALQKTLTATRVQLADVNKEMERLAQQREQTQKELAKLDGQLGTEEAKRQHCQQALARELRELPSSWKADAAQFGLGEMNRWTTERESLVQARTEERGEQLHQARAGLATLRQDMADLQSQQAHFPEEARQPVETIQALHQQARQRQRSADEALTRARQRLTQLESDQRQRQQLQDDCLRTEREHAQAKTLAVLLGRDRLQLHLVRQAERQVVDHANAVLDRLSGGQLYLRLCGEADGDSNTAKALELEAYNRAAGEKPINVAFLSGSQKFRVAVSLAMGIGQYASRQHRPIESVIIDEGFGCLDRQGRQVMIQELQNLRGHLHCILLVSHQEEFAEAFSDGYHFELEDGSTRVTPFRR